MRLYAQVSFVFPCDGVRIQHERKKSLMPVANTFNMDSVLILKSSLVDQKQTLIPAARYFVAFLHMAE